MKSVGPTRRQILLGGAASVGLLLRDGGMPLAQSPPSRPPAAGAAPGTPLIPRRILFAGPDRTVVRLSPDGRRIAFLAPVDGVLNLWVGPLADVAKARPFTRVTDRDLAPWLTWLPNSRHVVFFREQGGDENWQAHRVDVESGEVLALTPAPGVRSYIQQTSRHFPDELLIAHNQRDRRFFDLFRVHVATGASTVLETNDRFASWFTDPRFRVRFGVRFTDDGGREYLQRSAGGDWELFTRVDMADAMSTRPVEFSDDGRELYWLDSRGRDKAAIVAQDLTSRALRVLAEDAAADFVELKPYWKSWQTIWKARMGDYTTGAGQRFLEERSPLNRVDRIVRPLLIGQGANDVRVKPSESEQIVAAMVQRGIPVTYVYYSDEGHGFRRVENRRSFTAVVEAFLAAHLHGRLEPVGSDFAGSSIEFKAGRQLIPGLS